MARDFDRQVAELQVRIAVLNGYTALGISGETSRRLGVRSRVATESSVAKQLRWLFGGPRRAPRD
jgi:hypothetical protein